MLNFRRHRAAMAWHALLKQPKFPIAGRLDSRRIACGIEAFDIGSLHRHQCSNRLRPRSNRNLKRKSIVLSLRESIVVCQLGKLIQHVRAVSSTRGVCKLLTIDGSQVCFTQIHRGGEIVECKEKDMDEYEVA